MTITIDKNNDAILEASISLADVSEVDMLVKKMLAEVISILGLLL